MRKRLFLICCLCLACLLNVSAQKKNRFSISRGVNISHWLSQSDARGEQREAWFTEQDVEFLADAGFDHLRIPIDEEQMFAESGEREEEAFALLHRAIGWCRKHHLNVVVDLHILRSHHFNAQEKPLFTDREAQLRFYALWESLSSELKRYPTNFLAYELMNEPVADDPEQWNAIVNECLARVRKLEPRRTIVIGSNRWQNYSTVRELKIPDNDPNLMLSFHYYEPFILTHYAASWTDMVEYRGPVHYPGKLIADKDYALLDAGKKQKFAAWNRQSYNRDVIESQFRQAVEVAERYGLPLYCGEFGCINQAPAEDKARWYADVVALFDKYGIARANWDYKGGFGIIVGGEVQKRLIKILTGKELR